MNYWIIVDDHHEGPYTGQQLVDNGLTPDTLVWADGLTDWTPASEIAELAAMLENRTPGQPQEPAVVSAPEVQQESTDDTQQYAETQPDGDASQQEAVPQQQVSVLEVPQEPCPPAYIAWSIIATVLCCTIIGIPAIVFASMTKSAYYRGDLAKSKRYSDLAQWFIIAAIVLGAMSWPFQIALMGVL